MEVAIRQARGTKCISLQTDLRPLVTRQLLVMHIGYRVGNGTNEMQLQTAQPEEDGHGHGNPPQRKKGHCGQLEQKAPSRGCVNC